MNHAMTSFPRQTDARLAWKCVGALSLALVLVGCSPKESPDVLAKVGAKEIRAADLEREVARRNALRRPVPEKEALLDELIQHESLLQRAKNAGLDKDPQLAREMDNLLIGKLIERELTKQIEAVQIAPEEIKAEYEKNAAKYTQAPKARLAILFLEANAKSSEAKRTETRERLAEARRRFVENPEAARRASPVPGFGSLAVDNSDDQASRYRGGDIGWLEEGNFSYRWPKPVLEAGFALKKDAVSDLVETATGFYVVMKTDARPGVITPLAKVEAALRQSVLLQKRRGLDEKFRLDARSHAGVAVRTNALNSFVLPAPARAVASNSDAGPPAFPLLNETSRRN